MDALGINPLGGINAVEMGDAATPLAVSPSIGLGVELVFNLLVTVDAAMTCNVAGQLSNSLVHVKSVQVDFGLRTEFTSETLSNGWPLQVPLWSYDTNKDDIWVYKEQL